MLIPTPATPALNGASFRRAMDDRRLYGISPDEAEEDRLLEQRRVDLVPWRHWERGWVAALGKACHHLEVAG